MILTMAVSVNWNLIEEAIKEIRGGEKVETVIFIKSKKLKKLYLKGKRITGTVPRKGVV